MRKFYWFVLFVLFGSFATGTAQVALGASNAKTDGTLDWSAIIVAIINLVFPAVAGVATYLINGHLKNQQMAELLSNAVTNSLGAVREKAVGAVTSTSVTTTSGSSPAINAGIQYVINNAAEAISHFNLSPEQIGQKIEAKLGLAEIATNLAATASPAPIVAGPLAPTPTTI